jgi:hypothetical protein
MIRRDKVFELKIEEDDEVSGIDSISLVDEPAIDVMWVAFAKEKEYEFPFSSKQSGNQQLFVSNEGVVFMVKEIELPKVKPYKSVYIWNPSTDAVVEETLKLENDLQIHQLKGQFYESDFYIQGLYTDIGFKFEDGFELSTFDGCDLVFRGDIH